MILFKVIVTRERERERERGMAFAMSMLQSSKLSLIRVRSLGRHLSSSSGSSESLFNNHRSVLPLSSLTPYTASPAYIAPNASVVGEVDIENNACVFENAVVRGDAGTVRLKANACIGQVRVCVCVSTERLDSVCMERDKTCGGVCGNKAGRVWMDAMRWKVRE